MQVWIAGDRAEFRRLHAAYREAWYRLVLQARCWQLLVEDPKADTIAIRQAEEDVRQAEAYYRENRNQLADCMLARSGKARGLRTVGVSETPEFRRFVDRLIQTP